VTTKGFVAILLGLIAIFAWYYTLRVTQRKEGSSPLAYIFAGIVTVAALVLAASLLFGK